jgi:hypothetical protein
MYPRSAARVTKPDRHTRAFVFALRPWYYRARGMLLTERVVTRQDGRRVCCSGSQCAAPSTAPQRPVSIILLRTRDVDEL